MAASFTLDLIMGLYQRVMHQQKVVETQQENVEFWHGANTLIDVHSLTGANMQEETQQLGEARGILDDLHIQLEAAIASWSCLSPGDKRGAQLPWAQFPARGHPLPTKTGPLTISNPTPNTPSLYDPSVGVQSRYNAQWQSWLETPKVTNPSTTLDLAPTTPWWMQDRDHYGLLQPSEQGQLENAARVAQSHRNARSSSVDFSLDEDYDPHFWQKNLRPGNLWANPSRPRVPDENVLSPRTRGW